MLLSVVAGAILFITYLVLAVGRAPYLRIDRRGDRQRYADDRVVVQKV